jgi:hypothetical protein
VKLDDVDDWAWKGGKKDKKTKKNPKAKEHDKIIKDLNKKFNESRDKMKTAKLEIDRKKQEEFEKKKQAKI